MVMRSGSWTVKGGLALVVFRAGVSDVRKWPVAPVSRMIGAARDNAGDGTCGDGSLLVTLHCSCPICQLDGLPY